MANLYDAQSKINEAMQNKIYEIGKGVLVNYIDVASIALEYNYNSGYVDGLKHALMVIGDVIRGDSLITED